MQAVEGLEFLVYGFKVLTIGHPDMGPYLSSRKYGHLIRLAGLFVGFLRSMAGSQVRVHIRELWLQLQTLGLAPQTKMELVIGWSGCQSYRMRWPAAGFTAVRHQGVAVTKHNSAQQARTSPKRAQNGSWKSEQPNVSKILPGPQTLAKECVMGQNPSKLPSRQCLYILWGFRQPLQEAAASFKNTLASFLVVSVIIGNPFCVPRILGVPGIGLRVSGFGSVVCLKVQNSSSMGRFWGFRI